MSATLRRRIEALEAARQAAQEAASARRARGIPEADFAARLAALLTLGHPRLMAITARARSVLELVGWGTPAPAPVVRVSDAAEVLARAREVEAERVTAELMADQAADAAARRAAEAYQASQPPARPRGSDWFSQFKHRSST